MVIPKRKKMKKITKQSNAIVIYNLFYSFHYMVWRFLGICTCSNSIFFFGCSFDSCSIHRSYILLDCEFTED